MTLDPVRGIKFGAASALCAAFTFLVNQKLGVWDSSKGTIAGAAIAMFVACSIIGTFTDKIGSDSGEQ